MGLIQSFLTFKLQVKKLKYVYHTEYQSTREVRG